MRTMILLSILVSLVVVKIGGPYLEPSFTTMNPYDRTYLPIDHPSVFLLNSEVGRCTGWVIDEGYIATAAHCTAGLKELEADLPSGPEKFVLVYQGQPESSKDVAILKGNTHGLVPYKLADQAEDSPECFAVGHGGQKDEFTIPCVIIKRDEAGYLEAVAEVRPGDSGGPVLGKDMKIVGVIVAMSMIFDAQGYFVDVSEVRKALEKAKRVR